MSNLDMAATHLNVSVGAVLSAKQLALALQSASLDVLANDPPAAAAASYLFVEIDPRMIALCAYESGTDIAHANQLYLDSVRHAMPRVPAWEASVEALL